MHFSVLGDDRPIRPKREAGVVHVTGGRVPLGDGACSDEDGIGAEGMMSDRSLRHLRTKERRRRTSHEENAMGGGGAREHRCRWMRLGVDSLSSCRDRLGVLRELICSVRAVEALWQSDDIRAVASSFADGLPCRCQVC